MPRSARRLGWKVERRRPVQPAAEMDPDGHQPETVTRTTAQFATTHWSVVLAAGHDSSPDTREALETLCRTYWYPLYAFARRCGQGPEDAKDLVQDFFAYLLSRRALRLADPAKGRFRSYLLTSLKHFESAQVERARAVKRGGGKPVVSLDETVAEGRYRMEARDDSTPERLYEREWALTLLEQARSRLQAEYVTSGRIDLCERLKQFPFGEQAERSFAAASHELGMTEAALKSAVYRMRRRYQELVREVVAQTVADPAELEDEVRHLLEVVSG
jgi:DNA-directed RNA polymerase specialized sigma24 family protein